MIGLPTSVVALSPHNPAWSELFQEQAARIRDVIGAYVLDVQHVGSTAIPGIQAKPIIDIGVAVASFEEATRCIAPLEALGFNYRGENGIPRRHYFNLHDGSRRNVRTHHLHMNEIGSDDWRAQICFRDALRQRAHIARSYEDLKKSLAARFPTAPMAYLAGKDKFIRKVLAQMLVPTNLQPGDELTVRALKADGHCYRWFTVTVESISDDELVCTHEPNLTIHQPDGNWISRYAIRTYYWFDRPYNLLEVYHPDGSYHETYVHIASRPWLMGPTLTYTDYELDVVQLQGGAPFIADEDEFAAAATEYAHTPDFQRFCYDTAYEVIELVQAWSVTGWKTGMNIR